VTAMVIDASVTIPWLISAEASPGSDALLELVEREGGHVPSLWRIEVCNVLVKLHRRHLASDLDLARYVDDLRELPIQVEPLEEHEVDEVVVPLAVGHGLTVYDAVYLHLAKKCQLPLATFDRELARAARRDGISVVGVDETSI
jgi:predicted nucleic acid-binding protein